MASSGKKGKKVKGKTIPLTEFIGDSPVRKFNWSDEVDNEDAIAAEGSTVEYSRRDKVVLPTAPRANRPDVDDDDKIPQNPPYLSYLSNLPYEVNEDEIAEFFKDLDVVNVRLPRDDRQSGKLKGFGYVEFGTRESLISALNIPDKNIKQRHIRIEVADNSQDDRRRGGMRGSDRDREVKSRPRLNLQPRTKPVEKVAKIEPAQTRASIFGGAKPVDTAAKQREIEERLAAKEKEIDVSWPSTRESGRTEDSRREDRSIRPLIIQSRSSALPGQAHERSKSGSEYGDRDEDASEPKKLEPAPLPKGNAWNKPQGPRKELALARTPSMAEVATSPLLLPIATRHLEMSPQKGTSPLEARALESTRLLEEKVQRDMPEIKEMREGVLPHVEINMSEMIEEEVVSPEKGEDIPAEVEIDREGGEKEGHFQKGIVNAGESHPMT
uniref:RRM domain-containing protein n=1 Tax=Timema cristinae TaxID=61476 RepID=A0A7R9CET2_TIMCR|nr:unnamed protein product [Timema cristinae]